jgi:23S rRNA (guanine1835-N2)-methyltransferase
MPNALTELKRYPYRKNDPLQAWDSADELILQYLETLDLSDKRILIINDQFGALSCSLLEYEVTSYTDSYVSSMGIQTNSNKKIVPIHDLNNLSGLYDYVLIKIPKSLSFFEDILCHLTSYLHDQSKLICGCMIKHLSPSSFDLLSKYIGQTTTSLAQKKARLIFAEFQKSKADSPYPKKVNLEFFDIPFIHHSNLFSREKLDIGTRFFLDHLPRGEFTQILDLGCANGIIGIKAQMLNPMSKVIFTDDSNMAIKSAKENYQIICGGEADFVWTNCYESGQKNSLDLVLCNPPFHQNNTIGDFIAWQMFNDAYEALKVAGRLRIIGNSHLGYQIKLKKIFGNVKIIATNKKFIICESQKLGTT